MIAVTFDWDRKVSAYGAAHRLEDAIKAARDALEKAKCAAVAVVDLERAIAEIEAVRLDCLRVATS